MTLVRSVARIKKWSNSDCCSSSETGPLFVTSIERVLLSFGPIYKTLLVFLKLYMGYIKMYFSLMCQVVKQSLFELTLKVFI